MCRIVSCFLPGITYCARFARVSNQSQVIFDESHTITTKVRIYVGVFIGYWDVGRGCELSDNIINNTN